MSKRPVYKPLGALADRSCAGLAAACVAALGVAWGHLNEAEVFDRLFGGTETIGGVHYADDLSRVSTGLSLAVTVVTGAVFITWFHRCYRNLQALGVELPYSSKEAIWGWFVPIASLFRPAQIARAMWVAARPLEPGRDPIKLWWALFVGSNLVNVLVLRVGTAGEEASNKAGLHRFLAVTSLAGIAAALAAMAVVRQLSAVIEARRDALDSADTPALV